MFCTLRAEKVIHPMVRSWLLYRIRVLMDLNRFGIPIGPVGYTPSEFEEMRRRGNAFILEVLEKGKILYSES